MADSDDDFYHNHLFVCSLVYQLQKFSIKLGKIIMWSELRGILVFNDSKC